MAEHLNVTYDPQYDQWVRLGKPGGDYEAWKATQPAYVAPAPKESLYNPDGSSKNGRVPAQTRNADGGVSPATFEERLAAGEFAGNEAKATQLEVAFRRRLIAGHANGAFNTLPPDIADIALKEQAAARLRKARSGSSRNAVLGGSSAILGDY